VIDQNALHLPKPQYNYSEHSGITNRDTRDCTNRGRNYKLGKKDYNLGVKITNQSRDYKSVKYSLQWL